MSKNKIAKVSVGVIILILIVVALGFYYWKAMHQEQPQMPQMPPAAVTVNKPIVKTVERYYDFTGNIEAVESVEIRARIEGVIEEINFTDGNYVEKDQLLFVIEPDKYEAKVNEAKAKVFSAQAQLDSDIADLKRVQKAVKSNAVSIEEVSRRQAQKDVALANLKEAKAALETETIELSYTKILSPISGKISKRMVDKGNLVGAGENTLLATVVTTDPVYVSFQMSENILAKYVIAKGITKNVNPDSKILVAAPTEVEYNHNGVVDYIDNIVNKQTGTIDMRATVKNSKGVLYPGMFAKIRMPGKTIKDAILVEESAIGTNLGGKYVLIVGQDNIIQTRQVVPGLNYDNMRVIESGLSPDETYVTRGLQKARPGRPVTPVQASEENDQPSNNTKDQ